MIVFNVVGRVANDKDFLAPIFNCLYNVRKDTGKELRLNLIGDIYDEELYIRLNQLAYELGITDVINFTKKSIRYKDMPDEILSGYFLNFSIGNFIGYSAVEAVTLKLKTIIINIDNDFSEYEIADVSFCNTVDNFYNLCVSLFENEEAIRLRIIEENRIRANDFVLTDEDAKLLLKILH